MYKPLITLITALLIASGGSAHADPKKEALDALLKTYNAENGDVENLLALRYAVNDAMLEIALNSLDPGDLPSIGDGDTIIYEFSDYQCGFCRNMFPLLNKAVNDGKAKLVLLEFPILGPLSDMAARYGLAAHEQGRFPEFHYELMSGGRVTEEKIHAAAGAALLDEERLQAYLKSEKIEQQIEATYQLANLLEVQGTPALIINGTLYGGALSEDDLAALLEPQQ